MLAKLRGVLADANYSEAGIAAALHRPNVEGGIPFVERPLLLQRLEQANRDTLVTLSVMGIGPASRTLAGLTVG